MRERNEKQSEREMGEGTKNEKRDNEGKKRGKRRMGKMREKRKNEGQNEVEKNGEAGKYDKRK